MKKFSKKIIAGLSVIALTGSFLMGCSQSDSQKKDTSDSKAQSSSQSDSKKEYNIGVLQLVQHEALDAATEGFSDALNELGKENNITFNIDVQNASGDSANCTTIANQFVSDKVDLIMANATASLQAAATATVTAQTPVIGTSITDFGTALGIDMGSTDATGINVSGSNDLAPLDVQAEQIMTLFPDTKKVGCLYCSAEANSQFQVDGVKETLNEKYPDVEVTYFTFSDTNDVQAVAKKAASESDVLYIPTDNTAASNGAVISAACEEAKTPIICGEEGLFKSTNGTATYSISFYQIGHKAGEMAYDVLVNGEDISKMNIYQSDELVAYYNKDMAEKYNAKIPDDYEAYDFES
ncbi:putative ABC transport system substrate-binding protein [Acetitomaculum ruminis DSM 5522]|uniref:Putative ABC transport system substrate-binding protein n=1 Tax=Acetitomaculum ruminis DSM 5522 TaxID=1120918 RepID=A0A1I0YLP3_9FIRM|nr:ABC transporter substrate-binding protein [Acetitomaculum ruminis]SFB14112.1 putative ABC transport system substrate-binding protein [Acetitomaculum ruminis DSM 5522]